MMDLWLSFQEKVIFGLRGLYRSYGYSQYKMSKFEEYDLYAKNKDFLISDSVITFTDTNGNQKILIFCIQVIFFKLAHLVLGVTEVTVQCPQAEYYFFLKTEPQIH